MPIPKNILLLQKLLSDETQTDDGEKVERNQILQKLFNKDDEKEVQ